MESGKGLDETFIVAFQAPAGLNPVEVTVDVDLQEHGRVICRPASSGWINALKSQCAQIKLIHLDIDDPNRIRIGNVVVENLG